MAAGVPKTKWNGNRDLGVDQNGGRSLSLSYEDKLSRSEILRVSPAILGLLWGDEGSTNRLFYGDNLPILTSLLNDERICGKVRLIYIDPPYSTRSVFQSRNQNDAYTDLLFGASYVEFLRQRLVVLHELLAGNGSIYVHLDENMVFHIKLIMDEIFGPKNFRNLITRKKCNPKNYTRKTYGDVSDYILFYSKSGDYVWNRSYEKWTDSRANKEYSYTEKETGRRYKKVPIHAPGLRNGETGKPWKGMMPPVGKHWQYTPAILDEMDRRGEIYWSPNGNPRRKIYLDNTEGVPVQDIWLDFKDAHNQNIAITGYPTEKNPELIKRIIEASSNDGDIVLDCFCGSGTTLDVASELNRNWVGIDESVESIQTTLNRFHKGTEPMGDFVTKPVGETELGQTLPLFDSEKELALIPNRNIINDFALLSILEKAADLAEVLSIWKKLPENV